MEKDYTKRLPRDFIESNHNYILSRIECYNDSFIPELINFLTEDKDYLNFLINDSKSMYELAKQNSIFAKNFLDFTRKSHAHGRLIDHGYDIESQIDYLTESEREFVSEVYEAEQEMAILSDKFENYLNPSKQESNTNTFFINYNIGCRNCLQGDGINHIYTVIGDEIKYRNKHEYEVMTIIEQWRKRDRHVCQFCGSDNVEVLDLAVNDYPLYDYNYLIEEYEKFGYSFFMFNISKINSEITLKPGGQNKFDSAFLKHVVREMLQVIINRDDKLFSSKEKGNAFICINGKRNSESGHIDTFIQSFSHAGLLKDEIIEAIMPYALEVGITPDEIFPSY